MSISVLLNIQAYKIFKRTLIDYDVDSVYVIMNKRSFEYFMWIQTRKILRRTLIYYDIDNVSVIITVYVIINKRSFEYVFGLCRNK